MENQLAGWVSLVLCVYGLKAEFVERVHHPLIPGSANNTCVFPFTYGDVTYYNCISAHSNYDWCSLDQTFQGRWKYCTGKDPPACTFPFLFRKKLVHRCTKEGYILNRSWCSLTKNYNRDGKWKQCSPYKDAIPVRFR